MRLGFVHVVFDVGFVADYVMTGSTGHLNLLGWCDCNILLHVFIWVVLRSYGGGWREGGGFTFEVVVGGRELVLPLGRWLELRVVVFCFSKGRGFE